MNWSDIYNKKSGQNLITVIFKSMHAVFNCVMQPHGFFTIVNTNCSIGISVLIPTSQYTLGYVSIIHVYIQIRKFQIICRGLFIFIKLVRQRHCNILSNDCNSKTRQDILLALEHASL